MDVVLSAVKTDLNRVLDAGQYMLVSFFLLAVFVNYVGILSRSINWADVVLRLAIGFVLLQNYVWIMDTTRNIVASVDEMLNPNQDFISQYAAMSDNIWKLHEASTRPSIVSQIKFIFSSAIFHNLIINFSFLFYALIAKVMEAVRYSLIAILYKLGPALIPFVLFRPMTNVVKGWFTSYVSILCWPILWHIALGIAVGVSGNTHSVEQFACTNFAVCFVLVFSPLIINGLIAGIGASSTSVLAGFMSSKSAASFMTAAGQVGVAVVASRVVGPLIQKLPGSPTTATGKFKDLMLGQKGKGVKP
ncbi:MAG: hypothetical protein Q7K71_01365 [Candidatus Omnitrophota bacterium]|nr:hypothetical protein [Candidatus Omnitrophota bacterium]